MCLLFAVTVSAQTKQKQCIAITEHVVQCRNKATRGSGYCEKHIQNYLICCYKGCKSKVGTTVMYCYRHQDITQRRKSKNKQK